ncbi:MAG: hypothetical protein ABSD13_04500 [Candidatus Korobacteraceae bacterium]|jgi:hypothetical protein
MKRLGLHSLIAVVLLASGLWAESQGSFRGEVVRAPRGESPEMLYVMGRDGNVLRVVLAHAAIVYDATAQGGVRSQPARKALAPGTEVRVTALVDAGSGEWTASRVEVIANHAGEFEDDYGIDGSGPDQVTAPRGPAADSRTI